MGIRCELSGKHVQRGNNVSHSNRKTKRIFTPNIQRFSLFSARLKRRIKLKLAVSTLHAIEDKGGLDEFILGLSSAQLTEKGLYLKKLMTNK